MKNKVIYGTVCIDWNGHRIYTSFFDDINEAIAYAERMSGIIAIEVAHAGEAPVWERKD